MAQKKLTGMAKKVNDFFTPKYDKDIEQGIRTAFKSLPRDKDKLKATHEAMIKKLGLTSTDTIYFEFENFVELVNKIDKEKKQRAKDSEKSKLKRESERTQRAAEVKTAEYKSAQVDNSSNKFATDDIDLDDLEDTSSEDDKIF